jgi:hypothetical protein
MSVTLRPYRRGGWEVDIRVVAPDGVRQIRERKHAPVSSRTAALRWGQARERELFERLINPARAARKEPPTLREFAPQFMEGHARANRQKPSSIRAKDMALRVYLLPMFGRRKLDAITSADVQHLKADLQTKAPKTVNNVLSVLSVLLKRALEWDVIERMPCVIKLLPVPKGVAMFHDFDAFEKLVTAAKRLDPRTHLIVLLGGEAGLRCGEIIALDWSDIDLKSTADHRAIRLGRSDHRDERRSCSACAADTPSGRSAGGTSPSAESPRSVPGRQRTAHAADRPDAREAGVTACRLETHGRSRTTPHLLLTPGDAWRTRTRDSGARRASGPVDDPALHAPESGRTR